MEVKFDKKEIHNIPAVPTAPTPPTLQNEISLSQGKNLMKSAASLIGKGDDKIMKECALNVIMKECALNVCQNFLRRYETDGCNLTWFYHNNDVQAFLQDGPTYVMYEMHQLWIC
jgi:hypothetical protein